MIYVNVASGILAVGGRILLTQRRPEKDFPLTWECPGGKIEEGEAANDGLRREWLEELGCLLGAVGAPLVSSVFDGTVSRPDRTTVRLTLYRVHLATNGPEPTPKEGQGIGWFTRKEYLHLELAPGNRRHAETILTEVWP